MRQAVRLAVCALGIAAAGTVGADAREEPAELAAYTRDELGRLTSVTTADGTTRYGYFEGVREPFLRQVLHPDGTTDEFSLEVAAASPNFLTPSAASDALSQSHNRFFFTGYEWQPELKLYLTPSGRFYDPTLGRFIQQDSHLGDIARPPSLHRYTYANANPTTFTDPTGHFSIKDFGKGALNVVAEPFRQVADVAVAIGTRIQEIDAEDVELNSMLGKAQQRRVVEGQSGAVTALKGVGDTAFAVGTVGIGPAAVSHVELARAYNRGEISVDQYDAALSEMAGGQTAGAALATVTARASGQTWRGRLPQHPRGAPGLVPIDEALRSGKPFTVLEDGAHVHGTSLGGVSPEASVAPPSSSPIQSRGAPRAARAERLTGSKLEHMNASVAEIHGYQNMLDRGYLGIRGPGKTTARGADSIAFDPTAREVVVQDAKYRGPAGAYPTKISAEKLRRWSTDIRRGIEDLPDGRLKDAARRAFEDGRIRPEVFRWPQ